MTHPNEQISTELNDKLIDTFDPDTTRESMNKHTDFPWQERRSDIGAGFVIKFQDGDKSYYIGAKSFRKKLNLAFGGSISSDNNDFIGKAVEEFNEEFFYTLVQMDDEELEKNLKKWGVIEIYDQIKALRENTIYQQIVSSFNEQQEHLTYAVSAGYMKKMKWARVTISPHAIEINDENRTELAAMQQCLSAIGEAFSKSKEADIIRQRSDKANKHYALLINQETPADENELKEAELKAKNAEEAKDELARYTEHTSFYFASTDGATKIGDGPIPCYNCTADGFEPINVNGKKNQPIKSTLLNQTTIGDVEEELKIRTQIGEASLGGKEESINKSI